MKLQANSTYFYREDIIVLKKEQLNKKWELGI